MKNVTTFKIGLALFVALLVSCSEDPSLCEVNNTGTVEFENTRNHGVLQVFFDKNRISANGSGDLNLQPGERASADLSLGEHNVKVRILISTCVDNSWQVSSTMLSDTDEEVFQCQVKQFAY